MQISKGKLPLIRLINAIYHIKVVLYGKMQPCIRTLVLHIFSLFLHIFTRNEGEAYSGE